MSPLEVMQEARRLKVSVNEGEILAVIGKLGSAQAREIRKQIPGKGTATLSTQLRTLRLKGLIDSMVPEKWEWPTYTLTAKASAWKGEQ